MYITNQFIICNIIENIYHHSTICGDTQKIQIKLKANSQNMITRKGVPQVTHSAVGSRRLLLGRRALHN